MEREIFSPYSFFEDIAVNVVLSINFMHFDFIFSLFSVIRVKIAHLCEFLYSHDTIQMLSRDMWRGNCPTWLVHIRAVDTSHIRI